MEYVIKVIGIIILVIGVSFAALPALMDKFIPFAKVGNRFYIGGAVRVVCGVLLILASFSASIFWIPMIIGSIMLIAGILIVALGKVRVHALLDWVAGLPESKLRIIAIVAACAGALIIYSA